MHRSAYFKYVSIIWDCACNRRNEVSYDSLDAVSFCSHSNCVYAIFVFWHILVNVSSRLQHCFGQELLQCLPHEQKSLINPMGRYSNRLLFSVHAVLVSLKFCPVRKCTITYVTFVRTSSSLRSSDFSLGFP